MRYASEGVFREEPNVTSSNSGARRILEQCAGKKISAYARNAVLPATEVGMIERVESFKTE